MPKTRFYHSNYMCPDNIVALIEKKSLFNGVYHSKTRVYHPN